MPRPLLLSNYPHILHGGDYNPDQWLDTPQIIEDDFRLMKLAGCNTFSVGIFAWTSYEPEEGQFTFDWLDRIMDRMAQAGNKVILATPSGAKPAWMSAKYPEIRRVDRTRHRQPHQTRHNPFQAGLPDGVACQVRHKDGQSFYFLENFTPAEQTIFLDAGTYTRLSDGAAHSGTLTLPPFGSDVLSK